MFAAVLGPNERTRGSRCPASLGATGKEVAQSTVSRRSSTSCIPGCQYLWRGPGTAARSLVGTRTINAAVRVAAAVAAVRLSRQRPHAHSAKPRQRLRMRGAEIRGALKYFFDRSEAGEIGALEVPRRSASVTIINHKGYNQVN
jgi:hypothetical protein